LRIKARLVKLVVNKQISRADDAELNTAVRQFPCPLPSLAEICRNARQKIGRRHTNVNAMSSRLYESGIHFTGTSLKGIMSSEIIVLNLGEGKTLILDVEIGGFLGSIR
jgi:hypothetical protein